MRGDVIKTTMICHLGDGERKFKVLPLDVLDPERFVSFSPLEKKIVGVDITEKAALLLHRDYKDCFEITEDYITQKKHFEAAFENLLRGYDKLRTKDILAVTKEITGRLVSDVG